MYDEWSTKLRDRERKEWGGMRPISAKTAAACAAGVVMLISLLGLAGTARAQVATCVGLEERVATIVGTEGVPGTTAFMAVPVTTIGKETPSSERTGTT